jgi:hypothetical protein
MTSLGGFSLSTFIDFFNSTEKKYELIIDGKTYKMKENWYKQCNGTYREQQQGTVKNNTVCNKSKAQR